MEKGAKLGSWGSTLGKPRAAEFSEGSCVSTMTLLAWGIPKVLSHEFH